MKRAPGWRTNTILKPDSNASGNYEVRVKTADVAVASTAICIGDCNACN